MTRAHHLGCEGGGERARSPPDPASPARARSWAKLARTDLREYAREEDALEEGGEEDLRLLYHREGARVDAVEGDEAEYVHAEVDHGGHLHRDHAEMADGRDGNASGRVVAWLSAC